MKLIIYYIKVILYKLLPQSYKQKKMMTKIFHDTIDYDRERLMKYGFRYSQTTENLLADLRMKIHFLEKGLTMPDIRPCFGLMRLRQIADIVERLGKEHSEKFEMQYIGALINEYTQYHKIRHITLPVEHSALIQRITNVINSKENACVTQQRHYSIKQYFNTIDGTFTQIANSRHSVRNYISKPIPEKIFEHIAQIANTAPSACNRQPCHMHVVTNRDLIDNIFSLGVGCNGFGHLAPAVIIVTHDLECRDDITERMQIGVDTGFFGMNILYALHEKGIGACVLNWDNKREFDYKLRALVPTIKDSETVLFFISCGYTPEEFDVPLGLRKNEDIIKFI